VRRYRDQPASESNELTPVDLTLPQTSFSDPVWVDLRTGAVHAVPRAQWSAAGAGCRMNAVPVYDSPVLLAERAVLSLTQEPPK